MYSIFVTINVKPEYVEQFMQASFGDARGSVRDEPGCFRFDINQNAEVPARFHLYEVYRDEAAFELHRQAPHFEEWISTVRPWFADDIQKVVMNTVFPSAKGWEKQKPGLLDW